MSFDRIHYVCNAGVLVESGGRKVLVDGLINHGHKIFDKFSPQIEAKIIRGEPPFDGLDLVLVTHFHSDHFDRHVMAGFCRSNPQVPVAGSPQVMALLRPELPVGANLVELNPPRYEYERLELNGVDFSAVSLLHSGKEYEDAINLAYVLRLGKTFVHTGDAVNSRRNIEALSLVLAGNDGASATGSRAGARLKPPSSRPGTGQEAAFEQTERAARGELNGQAGSGEMAGQSIAGGPVVIAPFPYLTLPLAFKKFRSLLEPECLFIMHLPNEHRDQGGWIEATHNAWNKQRDAGLRIILAKHEGDVFNV